MGNDSSIDALETTPLARDADGRRVALVDEASTPSTGLPVSSVPLLLWWTGVAVALSIASSDILCSLWLSSMNTSKVPVRGS